MRNLACAVVFLLGLMAIGGCALFNQAPVVRFTASLLSGTSPLTVAFDASESTDPDGRIISYKWDFGDGDSATGVTTTHTFTATVATIFTVTLMVTDDDSGVTTRSQSIEVRVGPPEDPDAPTARITAGPTYGGSPLAVTFNGSLSRAVDGIITLYSWDFGDDSTGTGETAPHTYTVLSTTNYVATLTVTDDKGRTASASVVVTVTVPTAIPDDPPRADLLVSVVNQMFASPSLPSPPSLFEVQFDPSGSRAAAGHSIEYYVWKFGDGETATMETGQIVTHVYTVASQTRTVIVTLTVIDDQGFRNTAVRNVTLTN